MNRLLVAIVIACASCIFARQPSKIKGGQMADTAEFPWQVSLRLQGEHTCGGSIIDDTHILTAAHCVQYEDGKLIKGLQVVAGTNMARQWFPKTHEIKSVHPHEKFKMLEPYRYDIAIIELVSPLEFNDRQRAIELPDKDVPVGDAVTISGWGDTEYPPGVFASSSPSALRKMNKKVVSNEHCIQQHLIHLYPDQMCAYAKLGQGICVGDSGSGLVHNGKVVGIASWVKPCGVGFPDVYTRVYSYKSWISKTVKK